MNTTNPELQALYADALALAQPFIDFVFAILAQLNLLSMFLLLLCFYLGSQLLLRAMAEKKGLALAAEYLKCPTDLDAYTLETKGHHLSIGQRLISGPVLAILLFALSCVLFEARYLSHVQQCEAEVQADEVKQRFDELTRMNTKLESDLKSHKEGARTSYIRHNLEKDFLRLMALCTPEQVLASSDTFLVQPLQSISPDGGTIWSSRVQGYMILETLNPKWIDEHPLTLWEITYEIPSSSLTPSSPAKIEEIASLIRSSHTKPHKEQPEGLKKSGISFAESLRYLPRTENASSYFEIIWKTHNAKLQNNSLIRFDFPPR